MIDAAGRGSAGRGSEDPLVTLARSLHCLVETADSVAGPFASLPVADDEALLVIGSQAFNEADRTMDRSDVRSLQILRRDATISRGRFDAVGVRGLRDFLPLHDGVHGLATTANDLILYNLVSGEQATWPISGLADIHALTPLADGVLVASTATDEVFEIGFDGKIRLRRSLDSLRHERARPIAHDRALGGALTGARPASLEAQDHFHANEAFVAHDGQRMAVVHHVTGFRPIVHAANRLVRHGDGGVIDLDTLQAHDLALVAPHSARLLDSGYVILDSGRQRLVQFDRSWQPTGMVELPGWGRGFAMSSRRDRWFVGISATRRRYLRSDQVSTPNAVTALHDGQVVATRTITGVEQVWAVHLVGTTFAERLLRAMHR